MTISGLQRITSVLPWLAGPLLFGLLALGLGQDANWDLRNYHLYNPYAFLHDRLDYDVAPAQVANFYNPLLYVPYYFLVTGLPPLAAGFLLGALQGLNFPLLIAIARRVMAGEKAAPRWLVYAIALLGMMGAAGISELGTMFADNLISLLVLGGIWLLLANFRLLAGGAMGRALLPAAAGGLLFGLAAGLKQPAAVFCVGWCAALLVVPGRPARRISLAFVFGLGVLAGIAAGGGYWMHELWARYGNPLFPYFNHVFASPMAALADYRDARFLPKNIWEALFFPFVIVFRPRHTAEIDFVDLRFPLFAALLMVLGLAALRRRLRGGAGAAPAPDCRHTVAPQGQELFLLCGALVSYAAWLRLFGIYRYLLPLEMLAPLGIWLLITRFSWREATKLRVALCCALLLLVTLRPGNWGRVPWGDDFFGVQPPPLADPDHTVVLITGLSPLAYIIPFFPAPVRFLRIQSYFTGPSATPNGFDRRMQELVAGHRGPLYVLFNYHEIQATIQALHAYGLGLDSGDCRGLKPHVEAHLDSPLYFCAVQRMDIPTRGENK
jgi:hypothetical protein